MTTLLSLDPGVSTGWSTWRYDAVTPLRLVGYGTITGGLHGFIRWHEKRAHQFADGPDWNEVVAEDFVLDGRTARPDTTPLDILGALEYACHIYEVPLIRQRNFMKNHAPDDLLKRLDLWWPGKGHDRDSARHALALLKTRKHAPTLRWMYGRKEAA